MESQEIRIQKIEFNMNNDLPNDLFYHGNIEKKMGKVWLERGQSVTFDTYFNLLSLRKIREYTTITQVSLFVLIDGSVEISVYQISENKKPMEISCQNIESDGLECTCIFSTSVTKSKYDYLFVKMKAKSCSVIRNLEWKGNSKNLREITIACCFCTYKREAELKKNIDNLLEINSSKNESKCSIDIIIADNGKTLLNNDIEFNNEAVSVFQNKNYGGSGGFARCIIEACFNRKNKYTHVILMDDDALIEPYVVERTYSLLSMLKPEWCTTIISGAMFTKENPMLQKENGGYLGKYNEHMIYNSDIIMDNTDAIMKNESPAQKNYGGFYYCCIPTTRINKDNLPMSLFVRCDDEEFGKSNCKQIITLNGIAIWHPNPSIDIRPYIDYYIQRNNLIISAEFEASLSSNKVCLHFIRSCMSKIARYRYEDAWYVIKGIEDYYKGFNAFINTNQERNNSEIAVWKKYKRVNINESCNKSFWRPSHQLDGRRKKVLLVLNLLIPAIIKERVYPIYTAREDIDNLFVKRIILLDGSTSTGYVFEKSIEKTLVLLLQIVKTVFMIKTKHPRIHYEWATNVQKLKTIRYWYRILELEK